MVLGLSRLQYFWNDSPSLDLAGSFLRAVWLLPSAVRLKGLVHWPLHQESWKFSSCSGSAGPPEHWVSIVHRHASELMQTMEHIHFFLVSDTRATTKALSFATLFLFLRSALVSVPTWWLLDLWIIQVLLPFHFLLPLLISLLSLILLHCLVTRTVIMGEKKRMT
jgi:hypothetical protein